MDVELNGPTGLAVDKSWHLLVCSGISRIEYMYIL